MLVLERQIGEKIRVGGTLVIKVVDVEPRTVWVEVIADHPLLCRRLEALRVNKPLRLVEGVELVVISIRTCRYVELGMDAPREVPVHREEVSRRIAAEARA